jgi:hypothetical protein
LGESECGNAWVNICNSHGIENLPSVTSLETKK